MACGNGLHNIVEFLIKQGADVYLCSFQGHSPIEVPLLIEDGANVNFLGKRIVFFYMACQIDRDNNEEFLIKKGSYVN